MSILKGVIPVIPTPFIEDGSRVDYDGFARLVELAIEDGANAIALFGAGGEFYKLSGEEKKEILTIANNTCRQRVPLVVTVSSHATQHAAEEAEEAVKMGADVINIMPPSFGFPNNKMITEHVINVAKSVPVPVMIQYAPALTGGTISNETFAMISDHAQKELYIKVEASPTGEAITSIINSTEGKYNIVVGNGGECMYEALIRGTCAVMPGMAMLRPFCEIYKAFSEKDTDRAFELFNAFLPYIHLLLRNIEQFVAMEKIVLVERGIIGSYHCRQPNNYPDDITKQLLIKHYHYVKKRFAL